jgi:peroxiredoxin
MRAGCSALAGLYCILGRVTWDADLELSTIDGERVSLQSFLSGPTIVFCWASWCYCRGLLPLWQEWYERRPEDVGFVSVAVELRGADPARPWLERAGATFPALVDVDGQLPCTIGFDTIPTGIFFDPERQPVWIEAGSFDLTEDDTSRAVERFTAGEIPEGSRSLQTLDARLPELLREAAQLLADNRPELALAALEQAQDMDPDNRMIRKQRWAIAHPERFVPEIDSAWQRAQLDREARYGVAPLAKRLRQRLAEGNATRPAELTEAMTRGIELVTTEGVVDSALGVGDEAPRWTLSNALGEEVSLDDRLRAGPVVLAFYRGGWCPYCNLQLRAYAEVLDEIDELGGQLIAISPQLPDDTLDTAERVALGFEVLSDLGNEVARRHGIVHPIPAELRDYYSHLPAHNGDDSFELPLPATFVIDPTGVIRFAFVDPDYRRRAEPADVLAALSTMPREELPQ